MLLASHAHIICTVYIVHASFDVPIKRYKWISYVTIMVRFPSIAWFPRAIPCPTMATTTTKVQFSLVSHWTGLDWIGI